MKSWLLKFLNSLRTSLWFLPSLMTVASVGLAFAMLRADRFLNSHRNALSWLEFFTYSGDPSGARTILGAIAGSMITVAGTVFSITIVALSLASSQFGPRLLRNFLNDRGNQAVLGTFVATFLYCILVMQRVLGNGSEADAFVPVLSVSVAVGLGVASLGVLIYFIHHISQSMQAGYILSRVHDEVIDQIDTLFSSGDSEASPVPAPESSANEAESLLERKGHPIASSASGYVQAIDIEGLLALAEKHRLVVRVALQSGDFVMPGASLLLFVAEDTNELAANALDDLRDCFAIGVHRTPYQNVEFGIDQIVEVAVRALSPGINDPFTAIACIDRLGAIFSFLSKKTFPSPHRSDSRGTLRLILPSSSYGRLVDRAFNQIRQNARDVPAVVIRLTDTLARLGDLEPNPDRREALLRQVTAISEQATALAAQCDQEDLVERIEKARTALYSQLSSSKVEPTTKAVT